MRFGIEMLSRQRVPCGCRSSALSDDLQTQFGFAQPPTDIEDIAWARPRTEDGAPGSHLADNGYIYKDIVMAGCVSSGKKTPKPTRSSPQSPEEEIQPLSCVRFRQSQTEQEAPRDTSHRGNVAERSGEALPSRGIRVVLLPQEVRSFQEPVAGEN